MTTLAMVPSFVSTNSIAANAAGLSEAPSHNISTVAVNVVTGEVGWTFNLPGLRLGWHGSNSFLYKQPVRLAMTVFSPQLIFYFSLY
jgi:hypothetical protein